MKEEIGYQKVKEALLESGWQDEDLLFEPVMPTCGQVYRPDIVLLYNLFPLAVGEIKCDLISPELIAFNARGQAEALGIPFALITDQTRTLTINTQCGESQTFAYFPTPKDLWTTLGREWKLDDPRLCPPYLEHKDFRPTIPPYKSASLELVYAWEKTGEYDHLCFSSKQTVILLIYTSK